MSLSRSTFLALALLSGALLLAGGDAMPSDAAQPVPTASAQTVPSPAVDTEVIELRAQRDEMRRSEDRLLQVVVGALTVLALVNIAGYVVIHRSYDRDRDAIKTVVMAEARELIGGEASRAERERTRIERELEQRFSQRLQASTNPINERLSTLQSTFDEARTDIITLYKSDLEFARIQAGRFESLASRIDDLRIDTWGMWAEREIEQGRPVRSVVYYLWIAKKEIDRGMAFNVMLVLDCILGGLEADDPESPMTDLAPYERQALREFMAAYEPTTVSEMRKMNRLRELVADIDAKTEARAEVLSRFFSHAPIEHPASASTPDNRLSPQDKE